MNLTISSALNDYRLNAVITFLALGNDNAWCEIYDGTQPAFAAASTGCNLLAEVVLVEPIGTVSGGILTLTPTPEVIIAVTGVASWARFYNGNGSIAWDCDVSGLNGNGAVKIATADPNTAQLYAGGFTRLASGTLS